jgi:ribosomal protein S18 acetylase RimI-like enzyme
LPPHRKLGIGALFLRELMAEAARERKSVSIHVERFNPAMRLYRRLGFSEVADRGVYVMLKWLPQSDQVKIAS